MTPTHPNSAATESPARGRESQEQQAGGATRGKTIDRQAALDAIQSLRHACACNFSPTNTGAVAEARLKAFYDAYEAVKRLSPAPSQDAAPALGEKIKIHGGRVLPDGQYEASFIWPWGALEIPQTCRLVRSPSAQVAPVDGGAGPDLGATTREPSIRQLALSYYKVFFSIEEATAFADRYVAALATTPASAEDGDLRAALAYEMDAEGAWTWLVWAISPAGAHLAAIAQTEVKAERYVDATARLYPGARVHVERAPVNHSFGGSDLRSVAYRAAMNDARRQGKPGFVARSTPQALAAKPSWRIRASQAAVEIEARLLMLTPVPVAERDPSGRGIQHALFMARTIQDLAGEVDSDTKACRWLGYLQAMMVYEGLSELAEEKRRNLGTRAAPQAPAASVGRSEADDEFVQAACRVMRSNPGFTARDYEADGITAEDFETFFTHDMNEAWSEVERWKRRAEAAERRLTEPVTEAMLEAAADWSRTKYGKPIGNDAAIGCWNAMRAALANRPDSQAPAASTGPEGAIIEALCRIMHEDQGTEDADSPLHHPAQKSWEVPSQVRWQQWRGTVCEMLRALARAGRFVPTESEAVDIAECVGDEDVAALAPTAKPEPSGREEIARIIRHAYRLGASYTTGDAADAAADAVLDARPVAEGVAEWPEAQPISTAPRDGTDFLAEDEYGALFKCAGTPDGYWEVDCGQPAVRQPEPVRWWPLPATASATPSEGEQ